MDNNLVFPFGLQEYGLDVGLESNTLSPQNLVSNVEISNLLSATTQSQVNALQSRESIKFTNLNEVVDYNFYFDNNNASNINSKATLTRSLNSLGFTSVNSFADNRFLDSFIQLRVYSNNNQQNSVLLYREIVPISFLNKENNLFIGLLQLNQAFYNLQNIWLPKYILASLDKVYFKFTLHNARQNGKIIKFIPRDNTEEIYPVISDYQYENLLTYNNYKEINEYIEVPIDKENFTFITPSEVNLMRVLIDQQFSGSLEESLVYDITTNNQITINPNFSETYNLRAFNPLLITFTLLSPLPSSRTLELVLNDFPNGRYRVGAFEATNSITVSVVIPPNVTQFTYSDISIINDNLLTFDIESVNNERLGLIRVTRQSGIEGVITINNPSIDLVLENNTVSFRVLDYEFRLEQEREIDILFDDIGVR